MTNVRTDLAKVAGEKNPAHNMQGNVQCLLMAASSDIHGLESMG